MGLLKIAIVIPIMVGILGLVLPFIDDGFSKTREWLRTWRGKSWFAIFGSVLLICTTLIAFAY